MPQVSVDPIQPTLACEGTGASVRDRHPKLSDVEVARQVDG